MLTQEVVRDTRHRNLTQVLEHFFATKEILKVLMSVEEQGRIGFNIGPELWSELLPITPKSPWKSPRNDLETIGLGHFWSLDKWRIHHFAKELPEVLILQETWRTLHQQWNLYSLRRHSCTWWSWIYDESRTWRLRFGGRSSSDWTITAPAIIVNHNFLSFV